MRVSVDSIPPNDDFRKSCLWKTAIFAIINSNYTAVVMITLQYYDELKEAVKVPSSITNYFQSVDNYFISNGWTIEDEDRLDYSVRIEVTLPVIRWMFYVVTREEKAFERWFDVKPNKSNSTLSPKKLLYCLNSLSEENCRFVLGKLKDIPDGVINKLSEYAKENNLDEFSNVINGSNINTSSITGICMDVIAMIDRYNAIEDLFINLSQAIPIENMGDYFRYVNKVLNVFLTNQEEVVDDEEVYDSNINTLKHLYFSLLKIGIDDSNVITRERLHVEYHAILYIYYKFLHEKGLVSRVALDYLHDIVFNPKCKEFWKDYEEDSCISTLEEEVESFFIKGITEDKDDKLYADVWPLPEGFFGSAYIDDDCPLDEYFPAFLKDLIQFEGHNEQLDDPNTKGKKEGLKKLSNKFSKFIDVIASKNYIIDDVDNKLALAHALTGRRVESSVKKVKWSKPKTSGTENDHINSICFLIDWLYPSNISGLESGKYKHILTVFDGLEGTKPGNNVGFNVKKSPIKKIAKSFLSGLMECASIVNKENLDLRMKEFEKRYGKN